MCVYVCMFIYKVKDAEKTYKSENKETKQKKILKKEILKRR